MFLPKEINGLVPAAEAGARDRSNVHPRRSPGRRAAPGVWLRLGASLLAGAILGFGSTLARAQTTNALAFSVAAYDKLFTTLTAGQSTVTVGDMVFDVDMLRAWQERLKAQLAGKSTGPRGAFDFTTWGGAWPNGVVTYQYATTGTNAMPANKQVLFEQALRLWQEVASVNFVPRTTEADYILVTYTGDADDAPMNAYVGRRGGEQSLRVAGWGNVIDCAHELGHALGLTHEQCRPDRDTFVTLFPANMSVDPATDVNFAVVPTTIMRTGYDYDSLMHYSRGAFPKTNGLVTMLANSPNEKWSDGKGPEEIGQKDHLSTGDKLAMSVQYGEPLSIGGHIQDAGGRPLAGVTVTLQTGGSTYRGLNPITTDLNGNYTFGGIPRNTGTYTVTPSQLGATFTVASQSVTITTSSVSSVDFVQTDAAPPDLIITEPTPSGVYQTRPTAYGTASDNAGLKEVRVALARTADLVWWDWVNGVWGTTVFDWATNAKIATGTTSWSVDLPPFTDGGYQVHVQSVDNSDNASPWLLRHFFMDPTPPTVVITRPVNNANIALLGSLRGTASDGNGTGISSNLVYFTLYNDGDFWTGFHWKSDTTAQDPEVLLKADVVGGEWSYTQLPQDSNARVGQYAVSAFVKDGATNVSAPNPGVSSVLFIVDRSQPTVAITSPVNGSTIDSLPSGNWFSGTASDNIAIASVNLFIRRELDGLYWNGSGWSALSTPASVITSSFNAGAWQNNSSLPVPGSTLVNGTYAFIAVAVDPAGNQTQVDANVTVDYHPVYTWTAGSFSDLDPNNNNHNWDNPANWSPDGVPTVTSKAIISGGTPNASHLGTILIYGVDFSSGTLSFDKLKIADGGTFDWSGGTLQANQCRVVPSASLNISGAAEKYLPYGVLTNAGTVTWSGSGQITGGNGARIDNTGLWEVTGDAALYYNNAGNYVTFNNHPTGVLRKQTGTGTTHFHPNYGGWQLNNAGLIDVQSGVLLLEQGSKNLNTGGSVTGAGRLRSAGGTLTLTGTTTLGAGATVELATGTLTGNGTFDGTGTFEWTGGGIAGGTITVGADANLLLSPGADRALYGGAVLNNNGTGLATLANTWIISSGATFNNNGLFTLQSDFTLYYDNGGNFPTFNNAGTLRKTGSGGRLAFHVNYGGTRFNNTGLVDVQQGVLELGGGGLGAGTWQVADSALVEFTGNTMTLTNGTAFSGAGTNRVNGGRVNFNNAEGETVSVSGVFELANGWWGGSGRFVGGGRLGWNAGTVDGLVSIAPSLQLQINGAAEKYLGSGVITNAGTVMWGGDGQITGGNGARIDNTGLWEVTGDAALYYNNAGNGVAFNNHPTGILRKRTGTGTTHFHPNYGGWQLNNAGLIDVQSGVLLLEQASKNLNDGGSVTGAGRVRSAGGTLTLTGTTTLGTGATVEVASGTLTGNGAFGGTGTFEWTGGGIAGGTITVGADASLRLSSGADRALYSGAVFNNQGSGVATLTNTWIISSGATFINSGLLTLQSDFTIYYDNGGSSPGFNNAGTLRKSGSNGRVALHTDYGGVRFNNAGLVDVQQGTLAFGGGGWGGGAWQVAGNALLEFTGNTMTLTNGTAFSGAGTNRVNGGRVNFSNTGSETVTVNGVFELTNGWWGGSGSFVGGGRLGWNAGTVDGFVSIAPGLQLQISGSAEKYLGSGVITNAGTVTWSGSGQITGGNGARIDNTGLWEVTGDAALYYNNAGNYVTFNNHPTGVLRKQTGTGTTHFHPNYGGWQLNNAGLIDVQSGVLLLEQGSKNLNDGGSVTGAGRLRSAGGTLTLTGTTTLGAGATVEVASGTLTGNGAFGGTGTFEWTGGGIASGAITVGAGANLLLSPGTDRALYGGAVLNNNGTGLATLANTWIISSGATFNNNGLFTLQSDFTIRYDNSGSSSVNFNNAAGAVIRRSTSAGTVLFSGDFGGVIFNNAGILDVQSGIVRVDSRHSQAPAATLKLALGGTVAGSGYSQENFGGAAQFDGVLQITLTNGFTVAQGNSFTLATYASRNGEFSSAQLPPLPKELTWKLEYGPTALTLLAQQATVVENLIRMSDGQFKFDVNGPASSSCVIEVSTDLINWSGILTNTPFTGVFNFTDPDAVDQDRRFYRIKVIQ